jgi:hypothetical protein
METKYRKAFLFASGKKAFFLKKPHEERTLDIILLLFKIIFRGRFYLPCKWP